jgi:MerR family transcriptional regulator, repressor of the yfmOP operon
VTLTAPGTGAHDRHDDPETTDRLLRIQEVAEEVGLTARSIRYYEEKGLLKPAARSEGDYRLYDADDVERLRFIKGLRDDAGFSLADILQLLEDESARARTRARFRATTDPAERKALLHEGIDRIDRQVETLRTKIARLEAMIEAAVARRGHLEGHLAELETTGTIAPHPAGAAAHATPAADPTAAGTER